MIFRTEIEPVSTKHSIALSTPLLMLGSCFSDNIGERLAIDGFDVIHNPTGPLYNPMSIASCLMRATTKRDYGFEDLIEGPNGYHCLDFASRYSGHDTEALLLKTNNDFSLISERIQKRGTMIITFGTAYIFERNGIVVGNCHKFPANEFVRRMVTASEITDSWSRIIDTLPADMHIIFTVSPIRHTADGLHGNQLSKATLLTAVDRLCTLFGDRAEYFPSYEIMLDDLRDYRFYAADMKHPSEVAVDYIYSIFCNSYMSSKTRAEAVENRRKHRATQHRPIL